MLYKIQLLAKLNLTKQNYYTKEKIIMLRDFICTVDLWGGDKIIKETVKADNPKKAEQRAKDAVRNRTKIPNGMIKVLKVEVAK